MNLFSRSQDRKIARSQDRKIARSQDRKIARSQAKLCQHWTLKAFLFTMLFSFSNTAQAQVYSSSYNTISGSNVGINNNTPDAKLHVYKSLGNAQIEPEEGSGKYVDLTDPFLVEAEYSLLAGGNIPDGTISNFIIKSNGRVGINTYSPTQTLDVKGTGRFTGSLNLQSDLDVEGTSTLDGDLISNASATFNTAFQVNPEAYFQDDLNVTGSVSVQEDVEVHGSVTVINPSGLGDGDKQIKLKENGEIRSREILVDLDEIPDYVFEKNYNLMPLDELQEFIEKNGHLPGIKSAEEFQEQGAYPLGEMNRKLLEKLEEMTLYALEQEERIEKLEEELQRLK